PSTPLVKYQGAGKATAAGLAAGPDGLYFTDLYSDLEFDNPAARGANVLRVRWVGIADLSADVTAGTAPLTVQFTDRSDVPAASAWEWNFGDGSTSTERNPVHTYLFGGQYDVRLRVTGQAGPVVVRKPGLVAVTGPSPRCGDGI